MWKVIARSQVRPLIGAASRSRAGYPAAYVQLERDPCHTHPSGRPFAYRITGPLGTKVCGLHLKNGYRLAFSTRESEDPSYEGIVEVLYVGTRDTRDRSRDVWNIVHDLFGAENPRAGHERPACCRDGLPRVSDEELEEFTARLRRLLRGR
jgi:hypothetical protein